MPSKLDTLIPRPHLSTKPGQVHDCLRCRLRSNSRTIICIADKALSYGGHIQWDADSSKITTLDNNESLILMAGSEDPTSRVLRKLDSLHDQFSGDRNNLMAILEDKFKETFAEEQGTAILHPQTMTREDYLKAISRGPISRYKKAWRRTLKILCLTAPHWAADYG